VPNVDVEINGRKYRMACEDGQQPHLLGLAERFNQYIDGFKEGFGEIGDNRLTVMAAIAILDELGEAQKTIADLSNDIHELTEAGQELAREAEELEQKFASRVADAARKVEAIATAIDDTAAQPA
jgi:cell division protein ZapA